MRDARDDLLFVKRLVNQALDRIQGNNLPAAVITRGGWRAALFASLTGCLDQVKAFEKADADV